MLTVPDSYTSTNEATQRTPVYALDLSLNTSPPTTQRFSTHPLFDYKTEVLNRLPSGYWRFDEASGTDAADTSGNGLTASFNSSPTWGIAGAPVGDSNTAARFTGAEYATVDDNPLLDPGDILSIGLWFKLIGSFSTQTLVDKGTNGYHIYLAISAGEATIHFEKKGTGVITSSSITISVAAQAWHFLLITKSGSTITLYLDGIDRTGAVSNQTIAATATDLYIGASSGLTNPFSGEMDELTIFSVALSATDDQALHESGLGLYPLSGVSISMQLPRGFAAQVIPEKGQSSIGDISVTLIDNSEQSITSLVMSGINGVVATLKMGFSNIAFNDFVTVFLGVVDATRLTTDLTGYELTLRDTQTLTNRQVFDVAKSSVSNAAGDADATIYIQDSAAFQSSGYARIDNEFVQYASTTSGIPPIGNIWMDAAYGNGLWVIVASDNAAGLQIATSEDDGITWIAQGTPEANQWQSIDFDGNTTWVAVANNGTNRVMRSANGKIFTAVSCPAGAYTRVRWCPSVSLWIASGSNCLMTSPTGESWTSRTPPSAELWNDIIDCGGGIGKIILVSPNGTGADDFAHSTTGTSFTLGSTGVNKVWVRGAWDGATLVLVAQSDNLGSPTNAFISTTDASAWTNRTASRTDYWQSIVWDSTGGKFVALNRGGNSSGGHTVSSDGATWVNGGDTPLNSHWVGLRANAGIIIAVGDGNYQGARYAGDTLARSTDAGATWSLTRSSLNGLTRGVLMSSAATHSVGAFAGEVIYIAPAHPADIVLACLQNTDKSGASISASLIDVTGIGTTLKNTVGSSYQMTFIVNEPQNLKTWLETEIYLPLQWYQVPSAGKYSVHQSTVPSASVATITHDDIIVNGNQIMLGWDDNFKSSVINYVVYQYDYDEITGQFKKTSEPFQDAVSVANGKKPHVISSRGLKVRLTGTADLISTVGNTLITRYRYGAPLIHTRLFLQKNLLEPGDIIALTSALLPNPANGERGLRGVLMEVLSRGIIFDQGYVDLTLLWPAWRGIESAETISALLLTAGFITDDSLRRQQRPIEQIYGRSGQ